MTSLENSIHEYGILSIVFIAIILHICVIAIRKISQTVLTSRNKFSGGKVKSIVSLISSVIVFILYFISLGLILNHIGVSLTAYVASASVIGLAVGFGSQGIVQDVVTGVTLIFSDLFDIGDMVEISGQTGIVKRIGMRFTKLENSLGASIFIPNRTINAVINYPKGYVRCLVDIILPKDEKLKEEFTGIIDEVYIALNEQFPGIMIYPPSIEGRIKTKRLIEILRVKFRIWPNRGGPIETTFKQELIIKLKEVDPSFQDWMISVNYETEKKSN